MPPRSPRLFNAALVLAAGLCVPLALPIPVLAELLPLAQGQAEPRARAGVAQDALPITRITLYRSGVAAFQRSGTFTGTGRVSLRFDVEQINDVLKSLQVIDLDKGRVDSVTYASKDPLARRLSSFSLNLADNPSLAQIFERLRGSPVKVTTFVDGTLAGTVLSVETRQVPGTGTGPEARPVPTPVVNLLTPSGVRSVAVPTISSFVIDDPRLADEMNRALTAIAESRAERVKSVDLQLSGDGQRRVAALYVHETPVWKTSYRLILPEPASTGQDATKPDPANVSPVLKGWALVENTTDSDWTDVRLALVSGRPVSFKMDLSEPLYLFRPEIPVPTVAGVMPREFEGGVGAPPPPSAAPGSPGGGASVSFRGNARREMAKASALVPSPSDPMGDGSGSPQISATDLVDYGQRSVAKGGEVGEQFTYEVTNPVTIERQRSAMIPIIDANVTGRRVSIFNLAQRADHPMRGVQITNSSSLQLLPGPISVYDGAQYAGDAQIGQVGIGDQRLLAYALDLDVAVVTEPSTAQRLEKIRIVDGTLEQSSKVRNAAKYTFSNKDLNRGRTIVLEHPRLPGWDLVALKPAEQTQELYRFDASIDAGKQATIEVVQERTELTRVGIFDYDTRTMASMQREGKLSQGVLDAFREAGKRRAAVEDLERQLAETDRALEASRRDQDQATSMMSRLDKSNPNYATISERLAQLLAKTGPLEATRSELTVKLGAARASFEDYVRTLNVE
jgi:hypothetical protein